MASGVAKSKRYMTDTSPVGYGSLAYAAATQTTFTRTQLDLPEASDDYIATFCGVYTTQSGLVLRAATPNSATNVLYMRSLYSSKKSGIDTHLWYNLIPASYVDNQAESF